MQAQRAHIKAVSHELADFGDGDWHASLALHYELQADTHGRPPPVEAAATSLPLELLQPIIDGLTAKAIHSDFRCGTAAVPDGFRWPDPIRFAALRSAWGLSDFTGHGLTCLAIIS
ncbi:hypothetical protein AWV79_02460 [Cupriavidus sp. UYMMa02A]|nr:hypothetical protein AWV79_02460 [Cupriavidus sp. UYMMa02A]